VARVTQICLACAVLQICRPTPLLSVRLGRSDFHALSNLNISDSIESNSRPACFRNGFQPPTRFAPCCPFCLPRQAWGKNASSIGVYCPLPAAFYDACHPRSNDPSEINTHSLMTIYYNLERCSLPIPEVCTLNPWKANTQSSITIHVFCLTGGESYTDLPPYRLRKSAAQRLPIRSAGPLIAKQFVGLFCHIRALSSSTLPISRQKIKIPPFSGDILFFGEGGPLHATLKLPISDYRHRIKSKKPSK